jgi:uncharacterized peroxidase-related enzyme
MTRIATPPIDSAKGLTAEVYAQIKKAAGSVPNTFAVIGAHGPAALRAVLQAEGVLGNGTLSKQDQETVKLLVSQIAGCDYCVAAHTALGKMTGLSSDVLAKVRAEQPTADAKRDALVRFVSILQRTSGTLPEEELNAIKAAGYTNEQIVEICLAIALTTFTNAFNRLNDTKLDFPKVS